MTNMLLWWTLDSVPLPLVHKQKVEKEGLQWRYERRAQVQSYAVTSIKPNKRIELPMQYLLLWLNGSSFLFFLKNEAHSCRGIRGKSTPNIFVPPIFWCIQTRMFQTYNENKNIAP